MPPPLLTLQDIHLTFGGTPLLEGAELAIGERGRVCLVGRNGSGKSTLLKIAGGFIEADRGTRFAQPGATVRYLAQEPDLAGFATTRHVEAGLTPGDRRTALSGATQALGEEDPLAKRGGRTARAARCSRRDPISCCSTSPTNHLDLPAIRWLKTSSPARAPRWC